jgi:adenylylsulfate kinase
MIFETNLRSFLKSLSYRILASFITSLITYALTRNLELSVAAGILDFIVKFLVYFLHERIWQKIYFGKKTQAGGVFWLTGLSGSGKSTLAKKLELYLQSVNRSVVALDGDKIREQFPSTGYSKEERDEHIKRVAITAALLEQQGSFVVVSLISPYAESRYEARNRCQNFHEIYLSADVEICKQRDVKGLYKKALQGLIKNFTGVSDVYEIPFNPELKIETGTETIETSFLKLKKYVRSKI